MSAAAATTAWKSPSHSHSHKHSSSRSSRPSTTPRGPTRPHSVGQSMPPLLTTKGRSPHPSKDNKSTSPSYFGFVGGGDDSIPPDSNPGHHARQNWTFPNYEAQHNSATPRQVPVEANPDFELFRRQSEKGAFNLGSTLSPRPSQSRTNSTPSHPQHIVAESPVSPGAKRPVPERSHTSFRGKTLDAARHEDSLRFDFPRQESPGPMSPRHNVHDHQNARLSLPVNELKLPPMAKAQRSDTVPLAADHHTPNLVNPKTVADLLQIPDQVLILDLRVYQQFAGARIKGALNLCIPTTLLKRPSFTIQKLADTFSFDEDKARFERWRDCEYIVVYDASSMQAKEAVTCFNVLKKFSTEGWQGTGLVVKGGFQAFARQEPGNVDKGPVTSAKKSNQPLSIAAPAETLPVAGGCSMPSTKSAANPFFGNIRQNMDLLDGVGQLPVQKPTSMTERSEQALPAWLRRAAKSSDEGKLVSSKFLSIEKSEQKRMQAALTAKVSYGSPTAESPKHVQVAGIEKGSKNRYNNILPFDHTRVRLQGVSQDECDYVNASHVKALYSNRRYIATQAPVPETFNDFWRVVWEQDVRVIVMLTAEAEGGQTKSHPYWKQGQYGPLKVKTLSERQVSLERRPSLKSPVSTARPSLGQRRSTTNQLPVEKEAAERAQSSTPPASFAIVRTFGVSHSACPFQPIREITQLQYTQWPDFGAPASPTAIVGLIEQVNKYVRGSSNAGGVRGPDEAVPQGERPMMVHCSAGCGRTGTYCTIDSVIDMLKRQKLEHAGCDEDRMEVDQEAWLLRDDEDLVAKTVDDFRHQRLSMVQNLRQFVLCYESILQWVVAQQPDSVKGGSGKHESRKSYEG